MTLFRLDREEPALFRVYYRAHGRLYALVNEGGYGRKSLAFYQCRADGSLIAALSIVPEPYEFNDYREP